MRPRQLLRQIARGLATLLPLAAAAPRARAQGSTVVAGTGRVSATVGASLVIPARLLLAEGGVRTVVSRTREAIEVEVPLKAAANLDWTVSVRLPATLVVVGEVAVQREDGSWAQLAGGADVIVIARRAPTNPTALTIRVRVPSWAPETVSQLVFGIARAE